MTVLGPTVGLLAPGAMGAAVAHRLTANGWIVLTSLTDRSAASRERAGMAGMHDASIEEIAKRARYVFSILPPSSALLLARRFAEAMSKLPLAEGNPDPGSGDRPAGMRLIYADCNAVSPTTLHEIAACFPVDGFVDACIIGGPPSAPSVTPAYDPTFYVSGPSDTVEALSGVMTGGGLKVSTLQAGVGDASALKMGYAGINKGLTGLTAAMILGEVPLFSAWILSYILPDAGGTATHASSPATSAALMRELSLSQPSLLQRTTRAVPDMLPKAYRFVGEMEEISEFVDAGVMGGSSDIWQGLARLFERVAEAVKCGGEDAKILQDFVDDARATLQHRNN